MTEEKTTEVSTSPEASGASTIQSGDYALSQEDLNDLGIELDEGSSAKPVDLSELSANVKDIDDDEEEEEKPAKLKKSAKSKKDPTDLTATSHEEVEQDDPMAKLRADLGLESEEEPQPEGELDEVELTIDGERVVKPFTEVKDLAQKGIHYTKKMQEFASEQKQFQEYVNSFEKQQEKWLLENEGKLKTLEVHDSFYDQLAQLDPDLYKEVDTRWRAYLAQTRNPMHEREVAALRKEIASIKEDRENEGLREIRENYHRELANLKAIHKAKYGELFRKAGLLFDEAEIEKNFIDTGMPLNKIYMALYGEKIAALTQSKGQLAKVRSLQTDRTPTAGKPRPLVATSSRKPTERALGYKDIADDLIKQYGFR